MAYDCDYYSFVVDNGSCICKAGISGNDNPRTRFPAVYGKPRHHPIMLGFGNRDSYIGDEAQSKRAILSLNYPIKRGVITDWDSMEKIWWHMFYNQVSWSPEESPLLITQPCLNPKYQREKLTELFFEKFEAPAFYVALPSILAMYTSGLTSGVAVDLGDGVIEMAPIYEGHTIPYLIDRMNLGGMDCTDYMGQLIQRRGYNLDTTAEHESLRELKETLSYTALDYHKELSKCESGSEEERRYQLPDGNMVTVNSERFQAQEVLFQPNLIGKDWNGIHEKLYSLIMKCDLDMRKDLYQNLIVSGGPSLNPGFSARLETEMAKLVPKGVLARVVAQPERENAVWVGGSILASLSTFQSMWITTADYKEHGPSIVHKRCF